MGVEESVACPGSTQAAADPLFEYKTLLCIVFSVPSRFRSKLAFSLEQTRQTRSIAPEEYA